MKAAPKKCSCCNKMQLSLSQQGIMILRHHHSSGSCLRATALAFASHSQPFSMAQVDPWAWAFTLQKIFTRPARAYLSQTWWGERGLRRPTSLSEGWCTCTKAPSCTRGQSSHSAALQSCPVWCCRWRGGWPASGSPGCGTEQAQPCKAKKSQSNLSPGSARRLLKLPEMKKIQRPELRRKPRYSEVHDLPKFERVTAMWVSMVLLPFCFWDRLSCIPAWPQRLCRRGGAWTLDPPASTPLVLE